MVKNKKVYTALHRPKHYCKLNIIPGEGFFFFCLLPPGGVFTLSDSSKFSATDTLEFSKGFFSIQTKQKKRPGPFFSSQY